MKTVCFFIADISRTGGTERLSSALAEKFSEKYRVIILSLSGNNIPAFPAKNVKYYSLFKKKHRFKLLIPVVLARLFSFLKKNKIDILIDVEILLAFYTVLPAKFLKIKHISWELFNFNADLGLKVRGFARKLAVKYSDKVVVLTERDRQAYLTITSENDKIEKICICHPSPVDYSRSATLEGKNVVSIGRFVYQKGYDMLLPAFRLVVDAEPDCILFLIGYGQDEKNLKKQCCELKLENNVIFTGMIKELKEYYLRSSMYVMSSRFEGFPMVLLEAVSNGLPLVSFDCECGPAEIIEDGKNGFLVPVGDIKELAEKMIILIRNQELRKKMGKESLKISKEFSLEKIADKWLEILE